MPFMKSRKGFALSIVMWIVAALLLGIAFVLNISRENLTLTQDLQDKLEARLEAQNYLEIIKYYTIIADYDSYKLKNDVNILNYTLPKEIILDGREYNLTKNVTLSMQDTSSMINLYYPVKQMIATLASEDNEILYYTIRDSIKDWIDKDNEVSLNGAEESYYKNNKNASYKPRNYPVFQSVDELRLVRGIDILNEKQFNNLKKYINSSSSGSSINLALVDSKYLSKLLQIDIPTAIQLQSYKFDNYTKFVHTIRNNSNYNEDYMGFGLSFNIKVQININKRGTVSHLETYIDFKKNKYRGFTNRFYKIY